MHISFLILAHKNPIQLAQLIEDLTHPNTRIYIHIDKKSDINIFQQEFEKRKLTNYTLIQEVDIIYSSRRYIDATLLLIDRAIKDNCGYFVLLSGLDKPTKPIEEIVQFYTENANTSFVDYTPIPYEKLSYQGRMRTEFYNFRVKDRMETLFPFGEITHQMSFKGKILNYLLWMKNGFRSKRNFPLNMQPYYSSQWFNFSREAMDYIITFLANNPVYYKYHKRALHPEEMFFQSIVLNSPLKEKVVNANLRYIEWKEGNKHPELLDIRILETFKDKEELFARKFDIKK